MKITFYTDYHIGAPNELKNAPPIPKEFEKNTYFLGDIFDLANCAKRDIISLSSKLKRMQKTHRHNWVNGNHERQKDQDLVCYVHENILAMHGDEIARGNKWSVEYRAKPHGASFIKRGLWVNALEIAELGIERDLDGDDLLRADAILNSLPKGFAKILIIGHMHVRKTCYFVTPAGRMIVCLPRGRTVLDTDELKEEYDRRTK